MAECSKQIALGLLDCWHRLDLEDAMSRLVVDAVFQPDCKAKPIVGTVAIRTAWAQYMLAIKKYQFEVRSVLASERLVFVERGECLSLGDKELLLPIVGVFEINSEGKVAVWRDYWDTSMAA